MTADRGARGGGTLFLFTDSGDSGLLGANAILQAVNSSMGFVSETTRLMPTPAGGVPLSGTIFRDRSLIGQMLAVSPGLSVAGGNSIAGDYIHYEQIGAGRVFAFGDRVENNYFNPSASNVNGRLFLDLVSTTPEPATWVLITIGVAVTAAARRRRVNPGSPRRARISI